MDEHTHIKAWLSLVGYVILPAIIIGRMLIVYPELPTSRLLGMIFSAVGVGSILVLLSLGASKYDRGSYARLGFNLGFVVGVIIWFLAILGWSTTVNMTYEEFAFQLQLSRYLWMLMAVGMINSFYYIAETTVYHNRMKKVNMKKQDNSRIHTY